MGGRRHVTAIVAGPVYKVPPAGRAPHLACTPPAVLRHPAIQRDALRTDGADMGRAIVARLGLGLLLLALLLPTQVRCWRPARLRGRARGGWDRPQGTVCAPTFGCGSEPGERI